MKERGGGVIINISSGAARSGGLLSPGWWNTYAHYAASKAGIESLTRSIALEGAADGIRVNAVAPGPIATETMEKGYSAEDKRRLEAIIPLGRLGRPEDIATAVLFLASPHAGYITGKTLDVNGGLLMD
jgi:NAD(P)-dependent dehydrogenase (short-subunit alcohol dehydrogenase family)